MSVKKVINPTVTVELGGSEYSLSLNFNALATLEELFGESALDGQMFTAVKLKQAKYLRGIVFACLQENHSEVTLEQVGNLLSIGNISSVMEKVAEVITTSMGQSEGKGEKGKP